jgi:hypothetical protein
MSYVAIHQPWLVLNFGPSVFKPLGITMKKAVEIRVSSKIKKYALRGNEPDIARLELCRQCS